MSTLLEKALKADIGNKHSKKLEAEEIELLFAAIKGDINYNQIAIALGVRSPTAVAYKLFNMIKAAYIEGLIKLK